MKTIIEHINYCTDKVNQYQKQIESNKDNTALLPFLISNRNEWKHNLSIWNKKKDVLEEDNKCTVCNSEASQVAYDLHYEEYRPLCGDYLCSKRFYRETQ